MLNLVLFNKNIFRKFEKYDSQIHEIMSGLRLVQSRCHSLSLPLDILLSNFLKMYMMKSTKFNINNFFYQYCSIPFKKTVWFG